MRKAANAHKPNASRPASPMASVGTGSSGRHKALLSSMPLSTSSRRIEVDGVREPVSGSEHDPTLLHGVVLPQSEIQSRGTPAPMPLIYSLTDCSLKWRLDAFCGGGKVLVQQML